MKKAVFKVGRIEALSDGVFAIVMTLLVLELKLELPQSELSEASFWHHIAEVGEALIAYFMSFLVLGVFWIGQHNQLLFIQRSDRHFAWLNIIFLSLVSLIPFSTGLVSSFFELKSALILYCANLLLIGVMLLLTWNYAYSKKITHENVDKEKHRQVQKIILLGIATYALALCIALFSPLLSVVSIFLMQLFYVFHEGYDLTVNHILDKEK